MPFSFFASYQHNELEKIAIVIGSLIFNKHRCFLLLLLDFSSEKRNMQGRFDFLKIKTYQGRLKKSVTKVEGQILTQHSEVCTLS